MNGETDSTLLVVGKSFPDKQADLIVTGKLDYAGDMLAGQKLFTRMLTSPYAHARVKSIDLSAAMNLEGVKAACTYEDCPVFNQELFYWGDRVAAVAATDPNIADQAIRLIAVEYEELSYNLDPDKAPVLQQTVTGPAYPAGSLPNSRGNVQAGFSQSDVTVEADVGWTAYWQHGTLEPRVATAYWVYDELYVYAASQNPFGFRAGIAADLGIPLNKVYVVSHGTGSAMGDKNWHEYCSIAAVLAKKAGMPVMYSLSRFENFLEGTHQFPVKGHIKIGAKSDGTLQAVTGDYMINLGASNLDLGTDAFSSIRRNYKCPNIQVNLTRKRTNKGKAAYWRGVGEPSGNFLFEEVVDMMAEKLGMDPLSFRLKNVVTRDMPDQDTGLPYGSVAIKECLEKAASEIDFSSKWHQPGTKTLSDGRMHGIGICGLVSDKGYLASPRGAIINVYSDGTALLTLGCSRVGAGTSSAMCIIAAETLGMTYDKVSVGDWGNSNDSSFASYQAGSTMTITLGAACKVAAEDARAQLFNIASGMLGVSPDKLRAANNSIYIPGVPFSSVSMGTAAGSAPPIMGVGHGWESKLRLSPEAGFDIGHQAEVKTSVASAVEVAVDTETGRVEILNSVLADDMGRVIDGFGARNQMQAGLEIMPGEALMYEQIWDEINGGACLATNYLENKYPLTLDLNLNSHNVFAVESIDSVGPYGCKGMGETPVATYGSIHNAVYNAIGKWIGQTPIFPQRILAALGKA